MAVWNEINISECLERSRFDAEYYQPEYRKLQHVLTRQLQEGYATRLGDVAYVEYGYMPMQDYVSEEEGEPLLRVTNIRGNLEVNDSDLKYVPRGLDIPSRKRLQSGDVLLVQCGDTTGKVGLINKRHVGMLFPSFCLAIRSKGAIPPEILGIFLFSDIGQKQIRQRVAISTVRPNTTKPDVEELILPNAIINNDISTLVRSALAARERSKNLYAQAEEILLEELGLQDLDLSPTLFYERRFSEAQESGRMDADFFQPAYQRVVDICAGYDGGCEYVRDLLESITNGVECRTFVDDGVPYIRVGDMGRLRIILGKAERISYENAERLIPKIRLEEGDVIAARSGSIGQAAVVSRDDVGCVLSSHLIRLKLRRHCGVGSSYLALFLATIPGIYQVFKNGNGGVVPEISHVGLKRVVVPKPAQGFQRKLARTVEESRRLEDESRRLLEEAKHMVENAVFKGAE